MRRSMSLRARGELLRAIAPRYKEATKKEKQQILDEFTAATGYHRKYAIGLLTGEPPQESRGSASKRKRQARLYTEEVQEALVIVWEAANRICSKRLVPFLPEMIEALERYGHLKVPPEVKARLLGISPASVDRILGQVRRAGQASDDEKVKRSSLLKHKVPIRTFSEWDGAKPGYMEADLVAHCGGDVSGSYLQTLTLTDVVSGWTECLALLFRDQQMVLQGVCQAQEQLPFPLLALDTDNGSEFLNSTLYDYCASKPIIFTRSRPYKKNDQCYVEQKNGAIVRRFVGYDRFAGLEACRVLTELYRHLRLYINFFQPSLKLVSKKRVGSRVIKKYDRAQSPYQRLLAAETVPLESKEQLKVQFAALDPIQLLEKIKALQDHLWSYAYIKPESSAQPFDLNGSDQPRAAEPYPPAQVILAQADEAEIWVNHQGRAKIILPTVDQTSDHQSRMYRRSKPKRPTSQQRWWRTRADPFADVWSEAKLQLEQRADLSAKTLLASLQKQYPGQFNDGQLRTLQRRVRAWRMAYISGQSEPLAKQEMPLSQIDVQGQ